MRGRAGFSAARSSGLRRLFYPHAEENLVAVQIDHFEIAHAVIVILRRLDHSCVARDEFGVKRVHILNEDAKRALPRLPLVLFRATRWRPALVPDRQA